MTLQLSSLVSRRESVVGRNSKQLSLATVFAPTSKLLIAGGRSLQPSKCKWTVHDTVPQEDGTWKCWTVNSGLLPDENYDAEEFDQDNEATMFWRQLKRDERKDERSGSKEGIEDN